MVMIQGPVKAYPLFVHLFIHPFKKYDSYIFNEEQILYISTESTGKDMLRRISSDKRFVFCLKVASNINYCNYKTSEHISGI